MKIICLVGCLLLSGCYFLRGANVPVGSLHHRANGPEKARGLVVFLPGMFDYAEDFTDYGFVDMLRQNAPGYDAIAVDLHFAYYRGGVVVQRLYHDIIKPARETGYGKVWLVGISMGGLGALAFAEEYPDLVQGLILLAPYMGSRELIDEVGAAGGLCVWEPGDTSRIEESDERVFRELWAWLKERCNNRGMTPEIHLGYGEQDRAYGVGKLLIPYLPDDHVLIREGGHKWRVWQPLFDQITRNALEGTVVTRR